LRIFTHTLRVRNRAQSHNQLSKGNKKLDLLFSIGLFSSLIIYSVSFVPYLILLMIDYEDKLSRTLHLYGRVFILINSCLNPILYGATNETFKNGYKNLLNLIVNRKEYEYSLELKQKKNQQKKELEENMKKNNLKQIKKFQDFEETKALDFKSINMNDIEKVEDELNELFLIKKI
jgi:hypothetical protein